MGVSNLFTGKLNICLECDYYTTLDKGAQEHSKINDHEVRRRQVRNLEISKQNIESLRKQMKNGSSSSYT
jgi:hypothetical protein